MGRFLYVTALRTEDVTAVLDGVVRFSQDSGVTAERVRTGDAAPGTTVVVVPPEAGWTLVFWPKYTGFLIQATMRLSGDLGVLASAVEIYDSDCWYHVAVEAGEVRDRYHSDPRYEVSARMTPAEERQRWAGDPDVVGELFGVDPLVIAPYFQPPFLERFRHLWRRVRPHHDGRAHPDDEFPLDDDEVVIDLWRRLGIPFPDLPEEEWANLPAVHLTDPR